MIARIVEWIEKNKIFSRKRKTNEQRALGMLLYRAGISYRMTEYFVGASYEAVREWYQKGRQLFAEQQVRKKRKRIAVDEKEISLGNEKVWLWAVWDIDNKQVIAIHISYTRNGFDAWVVLKRVAKLCKGKKPVIFVDGGKWYPWVLQRLGFRFAIMAFGPRSAIERFLSLVDWRIRRFWERFPNKSTLKSLQRWAESFAGFTNYWIKEVLS